MDKTIPNTIDVTIYGKAEQITPTISKCRVRTFYKYMNRNSTYITDEFAQQLIDSFPYTPIKGIFDKEDMDYTDHGKRNNDGRIYGIVPENPNFAWEEHMDSDGVIRTYACVDVLLFTGLYPEAQLIPDKGQSMEIFRPTLVGEWKTGTDGEPYYLFKSGCLVGLQVLGDDVEPCFEGAAFFELYKDIKQIKEIFEKINSVKEEKGSMEKQTLFRLSDSEKADLIFNALNPNYNEENGWKVDKYIIDVYDDYALTRDIVNQKYVRVEYTKTDDQVVIGDSCEVFIVDVTKDELIALEAIKSVSGTYAAANEALVAAQQEKTSENESGSTDFAEEKANLEAELSELKESVANYQTEKESLEAELAESKLNYSTLETQVSELTDKVTAFEAEKAENEQKIQHLISEKEELATFKAQVEKEKKLAILDKYSEHIAPDNYNQLKESIDNYTVDQFKKEVCTAAVESDATIFNKADESDSGNGLVYTGKVEGSSFATALERIILKHKDGGN